MLKAVTVTLSSTGPSTGIEGLYVEMYTESVTLSLIKPVIFMHKSDVTLRHKSEVVLEHKSVFVALKHKSEADVESIKSVTVVVAVVVVVGTYSTTHSVILSDLVSTGLYAASCPLTVTTTGAV
jgi:hypothetical protein